tara:strand:+ start:8644 stop:8862 length:219 start_codon:yes stop_codon:yes gene_type:complete
VCDFWIDGITCVCGFSSQGDLTALTILSGNSVLAVAKRVTGSKGIESKLAWRPVSAAYALTWFKISYINVRF